MNNYDIINMIYREIQKGNLAPARSVNEMMTITSVTQYLLDKPALTNDEVKVGVIILKIINILYN